MTPKEKADELVDKFKFKKVDGTIIRLDRTIHCALTCVDEILSTDPQLVTYIGGNIDPLNYQKECKGNTKYWIKVKEEINQL
jgi:hypothetical protein